MKGTALSNNCVSGADGNPGCNVEFESDQHTFGHPFNANGGGIYAMERDDSGIKVAPRPFLLYRAEGLTLWATGLVLG